MLEVIVLLFDYHKFSNAYSKAFLVLLFANNTLS